MNILIAEDEDKIADFIQAGLRSDGHTVDRASDGEMGLFMATESTYDLIILDWRLPKVDGLTVCKLLRKNGRTGPIMMLTARDAVEDRVSGLDAGADDYLTKPFSFEELVARIRALGRRFAPATIQNVWRIGDLTVSTDTHRVERAGHPIKCSATEFRLLRFLVENSHRVVSRSLILEKVWGFDFSPESNIVEVYINYLRDKIDKGHPTPLIQTIHGVGYRLCVPD